MEAMLWAGCAGMALFGALELALILARRLLAGRPGRTLLLVPVQGDAPEMEMTVRRLRWEQGLERRAECRICLVDLGLTDAGRRLAELLRRETPGVSLCDEAGLWRELRENICLQSR